MEISTKDIDNYRWNNFIGAIKCERQHHQHRQLEITQSANSSAHRRSLTLQGRYDWFKTRNRKWNDRLNSWMIETKFEVLNVILFGIRWRLELLIFSEFCWMKHANIPLIYFWKIACKIVLTHQPWRPYAVLNGQCIALNSKQIDTAMSSWNDNYFHQILRRWRMQEVHFFRRCSSIDER